jgi:adenylate cyclase
MIGYNFWDRGHPREEWLGPPPESEESALQAQLLSSRRGKIVLGSFIGGLAWALVLLLYYGNFLESYELKTYDQLCRMKAAGSFAPEEIVLVVVDQGSLEAAQREGIHWPWPRQMYAPILQFCASSGARAVAFDILFTESSSYGVEDDRLLAAALKENGHAVLPLFLSNQKYPHPPWEKGLLERVFIPLRDRSGQRSFSRPSSLLPIQILAGSAHGLGNVAIFPDPDGIYRRVPVVFPYQDGWIPSLGLAVFPDRSGKEPAVLEKNSLRLNGVSLPLDRQKNFLLSYYSHEKDFRRFSAFNLIQSALALQEGRKPLYSPEMFRNRIVFVGFTAPGLFDLKPTPISSVTPGMAVHATFLANLLHRDFRVRLSPFVALPLALIFAAGMGITVMLVPNLWQLALLALTYGAGVIFLVILFFWHNVWMDGIMLSSSWGLSFAMSTSFSYATEGRQRRQIKQAFSHYMSDLLIQDLLKHPEKLRLGGEKRVLTVFFSDLAGFTSLSEKLTPEEVVTLLNRYLTAMTDIILASGGLIDKYEGDAIMAFWGAPLPQEDHAARACLAALDNQSRLVDLREEFARMGLPPVSARIGINTGEMIIGNMGSSQRFDFTVIGDSVNLASRLEGAGKEYGVSIIISEETYLQARQEVEVRELDLLQVKGKELPVRIYELLAGRGKLDQKREEWRQIFAQGLTLYRGGQWAEAIAFFQKALRLVPEDEPARIFARRCQNFQANPPPAGWDGVYRLTSK